MGRRWGGPALGGWWIARDVATCVMLLGESRIQPGACAANRGLGLPGVYGRQDLSAPDRLAIVETCRTDRTRSASDELCPVIGFDGAELRARRLRSEEHTSELQSLMRISYAVFCLKKT